MGARNEPCPSCDRDLSAPGLYGHECYTYAEWGRRLRENAENPPPPKPA